MGQDAAGYEAAPRPRLCQLICRQLLSEFGFCIKCNVDVYIQKWSFLLVFP